MGAAKVLYHLRERIPAPYSKTWKDVALQCPDYAILRDVVDTEKHGRLADQMRAICNANQIEERIIVTEYQDTQGQYRHVEKCVSLNLTDGSIRDLLEVLTNVINFWQDELHSLGLIPKLNPYPPASRSQPIPRAECNHGRLDFRIIQGLEFRQSYQFRRYNYITRTIEPIDISGADLRFEVYKPQYTYEIVASQNATGQKITRAVNLTADEGLRLFALATEVEKKAYLMSLPQVRAAHEEIVAEIGSQPSE